MLGSKSGYARAIIARSYIPGFSQTLPAESSLQATQRLRAATIHSSSISLDKEKSTATEKRREKSYSTAAALSEDYGSHSHESRVRWSERAHGTVHPQEPVPSARDRPSHLRRIPHQQPIASPRTVTTPLSLAKTKTGPTPVQAYQSKLSPLEYFRGLIKTQPIPALISLLEIPPTDLDSLNLSDFFALAYSLRTSALQPSKWHRKRLADALWILHDRFVDHPLPHSTLDTGLQFTSPYDDTTSRKILRRFLCSCIAVQDFHVASTVFRDCLTHEIRTGKRVVDADRFARDLSKYGCWKQLAQYLPPSELPSYLITPSLLELLTQARLRLGDIDAVHHLSRLHDTYNLQPKSRMYHHLVQAYTRVGDLSSARVLMTDMVQREIATPESIQLEMIRAGNGETVLNDLKEMNIEPSVEVWNLLVQLRLDSGDTRGAKHFLENFDIPNMECHGTNRPNNKTLRLVLRILSKTDIQHLNTFWIWVCETERESDYSSEELVASLVTCFIHLNHLPKAIDVINRVPPTSDTLQWPIGDYIPDIQVLNQLLSASLKTGIQAIEQVIAVMRRTNVLPNDTTIQILVENARKMFKSSPQVLASVLVRLNSLARLKPSSAQLDLIFADAVHASIKTQNPRMLTIDGDRDAPMAGLSVTGPSSELRRLVKSTIERERRRGETPTSTRGSLHNRLTYEAFSTHNLTSALQTWDHILQHNLPPTPNNFKTLMQAFTSSGQTSRAVELLKVAQQMGTPVTKDMITIVLFGWGNQGEVMRARHVYESMKRVGLADMVAKTSMLQVYLKRSYLRAAREFIETEIMVDKGGLETLDLTSLPTGSPRWPPSTSTSIPDQRSTKSIPNLGLDEQAIYVIACVLSKGQDISLALDLISSQTTTLSPQLRRVIRKCINYLAKLLADKDQVLATGMRLKLEESLQLAQRMLVVVKPVRELPSKPKVDTSNSDLDESGLQDDKRLVEIQEIGRKAPIRKPRLNNKITQKRYLSLLDWVTAGTPATKSKPLQVGTRGLKRWSMMGKRVQADEKEDKDVKKDE